MVRPQYNSLLRSLRHDLQLTCLVLTVAIYSCSLALITWPTSGPAGCRRVTSQKGGDTDRVPWTGRSFDDNDSPSSGGGGGGGGGHVTRDILTSVSGQKCRQISAADDVVSTVTLTWCELGDGTFFGREVVLCIEALTLGPSLMTSLPARRRATLSWCSLILVVYLVYVVECWFSPYRRRFTL